MFRERDRTSMRFAFDLWSYDEVRANAQGILGRIRAGTMPCDGAWPGEWVEVFERWTQSGMSDIAVALPADAADEDRVTPTRIPDAMLETPEAAEQRVTPLELFFDLVFVFAITQVTGYVCRTALLDAARRGPRDPGRAVVRVVRVRVAGQHRHTDEGVVRVILLSAMAAMLIASLAVPDAFGGDGLHLRDRLLRRARPPHRLLRGGRARRNRIRELRRVVRRLGSTMLAGRRSAGAGRCTRAGRRAPCAGWRRCSSTTEGSSPAESRDGGSSQATSPSATALAIIIALGESIVDVGVGARAVPLDIGVIAGGTARDRHSGRTVVGVLRHGLDLRRATAASGRSPRRRC